MPMTMSQYDRMLFIRDAVATSGPKVDLANREEKTGRTLGLINRIVDKFENFPKATPGGTVWRIINVYNKEGLTALIEKYGTNDTEIE